MMFDPAVRELLARSPEAPARPLTAVELRPPSPRRGHNLVRWHRSRP
ncbi:hypothetical protein OG943_07405 [Amycolatopsis sp. NBC_00345]